MLYNDVAIFILLVIYFVDSLILHFTLFKQTSSGKHNIYLVFSVHSHFHRESDSGYYQPQSKFLCIFGRETIQKLKFGGGMRDMENVNSRVKFSLPSMLASSQVKLGPAVSSHVSPVLYLKSGAAELDWGWLGKRHLVSAVCPPSLPSPPSLAVFTFSPKNCS